MHLEIENIEEKLLAPRTCFVQIREPFVGNQKKSEGRIVNVPTYPEMSLRMLPRNYDNLRVILVKLKKRLAMKSIFVVHILLTLKCVNPSWIFLLTFIFQRELKLGIAEHDHMGGKVTYFRQH